MNAVPKTWPIGIGADLAAEYGTQPKTVLMPEGAGIWIQCELVQPPSMAGRSVNVFIAPDMVLPMLKELRQTASRQRSKAMSS